MTIIFVMKIGIFEENVCSLKTEKEPNNIRMAAFPIACDDVIKIEKKNHKKATNSFY